MAKLLGWFRYWLKYSIFLYDNNLTSDVNLHNDFSKSFIHLKSNQNIRHEFPGLDVNHNIHTYHL